MRFIGKILIAIMVIVILEGCEPSPDQIRKSLPTRTAVISIPDVQSADRLRTSVAKFAESRNFDVRDSSASKRKLSEKLGHDAKNVTMITLRDGEHVIFIIGNTPALAERASIGYFPKSMANSDFDEIDILLEIIAAEGLTVTSVR